MFGKKKEKDEKKEKEGDTKEKKEAGDKKSLKDMYRTKNVGNFPDEIIIEKRVYGEEAGTIKERVFEYYERTSDLRYGTNPHQPAAYYRSRWGSSIINRLKELKTGKQGLSQTNLEDIDRALRIVSYSKEPFCSLMKHVNPCGVAIADTVLNAYIKARDCDNLAAFGNVSVFNKTVDEATADEIMKLFTEVVVAPAYEPMDKVLAIFQNPEKYKLNKEIRIIQVSDIDKLRKFYGDQLDQRYDEMKILSDGSLILSKPYTTKIKSKDDLMTVTSRIPSDKEYQDLIFSWYIAANVRSNGVVISKDRVTLGVGTGQQDRVTAIELAIEKAIKRGHDLNGSVLASDGYMPNIDNIEAIKKYGITAIIQPGGSREDKKIIELCNQYNIVMVFTGERCFSHH